MLIYGNTPQDIIRIMKSRKWKLVAIVFIVTTLLLGYDKFKDQPVPKLEALDKFWDTLGSGEEFTKSKDQ